MISSTLISSGWKQLVWGHFGVDKGLKYVRKHKFNKISDLIKFAMAPQPQRRRN